MAFKNNIPDSDEDEMKCPECDETLTIIKRYDNIQSTQAIYIDREEEIVDSGGDEENDRETGDTYLCPECGEELSSAFVNRFFNNE